MPLFLRFTANLLIIPRIRLIFPDPGLLPDPSPGAPTARKWGAVGTGVVMRRGMAPPVHRLSAVCKFQEVDYPELKDGASVHAAANPVR